MEEVSQCSYHLDQALLSNKRPDSRASQKFRKISRMESIDYFPLTLTIGNVSATGGRTLHDQWNLYSSKQQWKIVLATTASWTEKRQKHCLLHQALLMTLRVLEELRATHSVLTPHVSSLLLTRRSNLQTMHRDCSQMTLWEINVRVLEKYSARLRTLVRWALNAQFRLVGFSTRP
jgi:hypothetical protein